MLLLTALAGVIMGTLLGERVARYALIALYSQRYGSKEKFMDLYDAMDHEFPYEMYSSTIDKPLKNYAEYLKLLQAKRPKAYKIFKHYRREALKQLAWLVLLLVVVPTTLLFWTFWYVYQITLLLVVAIYVWYLRYKRDNGAVFHTILLTSVILNHKDK